MASRLGITLGFIAITIIVASGAAIGGETSTTSTGIVTGSTASSTGSTPAAATIIHMQEASGTTSLDGETSHRMRVTFQIPGSTSTTGTMGSTTSTGTGTTATGTSTGTTSTATTTTTGSSTTETTGTEGTTGAIAFAAPNEQAQPTPNGGWHVRKRLNLSKLEVSDLAAIAGAITGASTTSTSTASTTSTGTGLTSTATSGSTTGGGETGPFSTQCSISYLFAVDTAAVDALTNDTTSHTTTTTSITDPSSTNGGTYSVTIIGASPGDDITLHMDPATTTIDTFTECTTVSFVYYEEGGSVVDGELVTDTYYWHTGYTIARTAVTAVSVDTRKTYGQPDLAGELPGDANAPPNYINFSSWLYMGGLFAGNADFGAGDSSGTSRLQLYATLPSSTGIVFETATLVNLGPSAAFSTPANLTGYLIPTTDANAGVASGSVTWATAWNTAGGAASLSAIDFTSYPTSEYTNFEFSDYTVTATGLVSVACTNEATVVSTPTSFWEYFADSSYLSSLGSSVLPFTDGAPRLWTAQELFQNSWTTETSVSATGCPS